MTKEAFKHKFAETIKQKRIAYPIVITLSACNLLMLIVAAIHYLR